MDLPINQKQLIVAMKNGSNIWLDDFGKTTYHIKIKKAIKTINSQTISSLVWRGLIIQSHKEFVLTDVGMSVANT